MTLEETSPIFVEHGGVACGVIGGCASGGARRQDSLLGQQMCSRVLDGGRSRRGMSRVASCAATVAASFAIVLLVILLVILWTGVGNFDGIEGAARSGERSNVSERISLANDFQDGGRSNEDESLTRIIEVKGAERNLTNEVDSREYEQESISRRHNDTTLDILPPPSKGDLEYVRPEKISQNQYEDPPDEFSTAKRHHSGHFRHATAEVWDPHPQYEFTAFGKRFRLRLAHDSSFVSPDVKVTHMSENTTRREHPGHQLGCFYSGSVDGDPSSAVSVSLCHGMTGHMRTSTGSYFIKPAEQWRENDDESHGSTLQHAIHRVPSSKSRTNDARGEEDEKTIVGGGRNCGVIDYDTDDAPTPLTDDSSAAEVYVGEHRTRRRTRSLTEKTSLDRSSEQDKEGGEKYEKFLGHGEQHRNFLREDVRHANSYYSAERRRAGYRNDERTKRDSEMESDPFVTRRPRRALFREYFIEIMVVADAKMVEYHGDGLVNYIFVLMSTVSRIYKDKTVGNPISIAVVNIVKTHEVFGTKHAQSDGIGAAEMLKRFCYWQKRNNPEEPSPDHHDAALLLTRENLCHIPGQKCDTLGLAELGRMCSPAASCAIVQDNGLAAAFTIAHEIGHVLNMPHDDDSKCTAFKNRSSLHNVMSRMLDDNTFPWEWSKCSRHFLTEFLEGDYGKCLLDEPVKELPTSETSVLPGEHYSENKQCELVFGPDSRICPHMVSDVCRRLWCTIDHQKQCHTQHMPWADGTSCGIGKWCHRGECVSITNLEPVDGQWGEWGLYGECSRTCGGGVKRKYRECNDPPPQNGGNYCVGERVKYRSCGTKECPSDSPNFREQQCSKFDNNNLNIQNLARDVKWHAKYARILPQDRCKLYCQVESNQYYMLREKVIDGTPCGPDTFHICVNGHCKPAGCDHVLNSTAELDTCGVCRGDNSTCQRITGSYNVSIYGYTRVAKIPAGSSNIDIRQHSWLGSYNDSNYLALRLGEGGEYILNGNSNVMHRKVIVLSGVTIEYSGPKTVVERLNSSRTIGTDLILEVLSVESILGNVLPPQITYEYTVPKKILGSYTWVLSDWSNCNRICQGTKYRRAECRSTEHKDVVLDDYCRSDEKPREDSQMCNVHCNLQWQVTSVSECSSHCGPGTRSVTSRCYYTLPNSDFRLSRPISDHACSHLERPGDYEVCMGPCGDTHWRYGEWGPCSTTCGGGIQFRSANCVDSNERSVPDDSCDSQEKHLKRICTQETCPKWRLGEWGPCSVTCGVGKRERQYWCHVENRMLPNSYCGSLPLGVIETCDVGPCQKWHAGDWSPCSVTCGEGISRRKVVCKNMDGTSSEQCLSSEKPDDSVSCLFKPCPAIVKLPPISYSPNSPHDDPSQQDNEIDNNRITFRSGYKWYAGPYGACTKSCDTGEKSRTVKCVSTETGVPESDDYCDKNRRPYSKIICNNHPCPIWNTGDWTQCNAECGASGYQHRQVRCQSPRGEDLPDEECLARDRPKHAKKCQKPACTPTGNNHSSNKNHGDFNIERRWKTSNWSACSKSCGGGVKTRRVECTVKRGSHGSEQHLRDEQCLRHGMAKPRSQRPCQRVPCDFTWQQGPWSECSAECGHGVQRRTVTCHRVNHYGSIDPTPISHGCPLLKPSEETSCIVRRCGDEFSWMPGPWEKCNKPCGRRGRQTRHLSCRDSSGRRVRHSYCPADLKPQRKRKCLNNERKCGPKTCLEAQKRSNMRRDDGEYSLIIGGRSMLIYCHGMRTAEPREYLTLPAGEKENYAEIYNKRLMNPDTCPFKGERNDSCHCVTERGTISGKTKFGRVRLDPGQLKIIANDYTFSQTDGNNRVEFGKAGDCYSQRSCPQGRFSIDLTGTRLKLSSKVSWIMQSPTTSLDIKKITDQRVVGRCGGYCGFCIPSPGLILDVLPP